MENKTLAQIIQNNIRIKNLEAESGSGDIVIYDNESGTNAIEDIALDIGAVYELFVTSAVNAPLEREYGQQKITIKLIPAEVAPNSYILYAPIHYFDLDDNNVGATFIDINKYDTELWSIFIASGLIKIYKIVKKVV